jgi:hypothetical protein
MGSSSSSIQTCSRRWASFSHRKSMRPILRHRLLHRQARGSLLRLPRLTARRRCGWDHCRRRAFAELARARRCATQSGRTGAHALRVCTRRSSAAAAHAPLHRTLCLAASSRRRRTTLRAPASPSSPPVARTSSSSPPSSAARTLSTNRSTSLVRSLAATLPLSTGRPLPASSATRPTTSREAGAGHRCRWGLGGSLFSRMSLVTRPAVCPLRPRVSCGARQRQRGATLAYRSCCPTASSHTQHTVCGWMASLV